MDNQKKYESLIVAAGMAFLLFFGGCLTGSTITIISAAVIQKTGVACSAILGR